MRDEQRRELADIVEALLAQGEEGLLLSGLRQALMHAMTGAFVDSCRKVMWIDDELRREQAIPSELHRFDRLDLLLQRVKRLM